MGLATDTEIGQHISFECVVTSAVAGAPLAPGGPPGWFGPAMAVALAPSTAQVNALTAWVDATFAMSRNVTIRAANLAAFSAVTPAPLRLPYVEVPGGPVAAGAQPGVGRGLGQVPTIMSDELYGVSTGVVNAYADVYLHPQLAGGTLQQRRRALESFLLRGY
jgi:hypothetical protein